MKNLKLFLLFIGFAFYFSSCESLEKTDLVRSEVITNVQGKTLAYELYLTGTEKYRYNFILAGPQDTTQLFEIRFTDETANNMAMEIEQGNNRIKIKLDKKIVPQSKTVDGFTYELEGIK
jgi:hypothetical protein